jgi:hypothetical protein
MPFGNINNAKKFNYNKRFYFKSGLSLDIYKNNLVLGLSYYKLLTSYTRYCVRVRRNSDNAEHDFGFVSNYIDIVSILAFCNGASGYVSIWYNQYSLGNNAIQSTSGNQPRIVNSGVFDANGLYFDYALLNNLRIIDYTAIDIVNNPLSIYVNHVPEGAVSTYYLFYKGLSDSSTIHYSVLKSSTPALAFTYGGLITVANVTSYTSIVNKALFNWTSKSENGLTGKNNESTNSGTLSISLTTRPNVFIGCRSNSVDGSTTSTYMKGNIKTMCIFNYNVNYNIVSKN